MRRRSGLAGLLAAALGSAAAACSPGGSAGLPRGWQRGEDGSLRVAVPSGWEKEEPDSGAWTARWVDPGNDSNRLSTIRSIEAQDLYNALGTVADAARSVTRGFRLVGEVEAWSDDTTTLARQSYQTTWPLEGGGTTWAISRDGVVAVVDLSGESLEEETVSTVGAWIELEATASATATDAAAGASATASAAGSGADADDGAQGGTQHVEASGLGCDLPATWQDTGALEGSARWVSTWALAEDGIMVRRLFLAPTMPQDTVKEAMDQIEADSAGGSLKNFSRKDQVSLHLTGITEALRTDFGADEGHANEGCIWVLRQDSHIAAIQYSGTGPVDVELRDLIEGSIVLKT